MEGAGHSNEAGWPPARRVCRQRRSAVGVYVGLEMLQYFVERGKCSMTWYVAKQKARPRLSLAETTGAYACGGPTSKMHLPANHWRAPCNKRERLALCAPPQQQDQTLLFYSTATRTSPRPDNECIRAHPRGLRAPLKPNYSPSCSKLLAAANNSLYYSLWSESPTAHVPQSYRLDARATVALPPVSLHAPSTRYEISQDTSRNPRARRVRPRRRRRRRRRRPHPSRIALASASASASSSKRPLGSPWAQAELHQWRCPRSSS